ncbi:hypothetical protein MOQ_008236 [Trypanosoma cruzi marinkellei]|uniref:Uncharacterized protein n=1 Tax=Trypanosoma cruzi marinkellei TaxID=85056 RepID=K2LZC6_TRYCR|nr:hypothetical protein MOQ_008236 [Trypanosoma cruzi marinkellei]
MSFKQVFLRDKEECHACPWDALRHPSQSDVEEQRGVHQHLACFSVCEREETGMGTQPARNVSELTSASFSFQPPFARPWRKTERSSLVYRHDRPPYAAGSAGPRCGDKPTLFVGAAEADFCEDMGWRQRSNSPVSSVEHNAEDDGEDFDVEPVVLKKFLTEKDRQGRLHASEMSARFCHPLLMKPFRLACGLGLDESDSGVGMENQSGWGVGEAAAVPRQEKYVNNDMTPAQQTASSFETQRGNTALNFNDNDLSVVRAIALALMEEGEKKRRQEMRRKTN